MSKATRHGQELTAVSAAALTAVRAANAADSADDCAETWYAGFCAKKAREWAEEAERRAK